MVGTVSNSNQLVSNPQLDAPLSELSTKMTTLATIMGQQKDISIALFTDNSGAYYVRQDVIDPAGEVTVTFTDSVGGAATPGAGLRPLSGTTKIPVFVMFTATSNGTGYSNGDVLGRCIIADVGVNPPTSTAIWVNMTLGTTIPTPTNGTYSTVSKDISITHIGGSVFVLGQNTSANSLSVTGASDGLFYVGGVSPDGSAPTNNAVRVSGVDASGLKRTFLVDGDGRIRVVSPALTVTENFNAALTASYQKVATTTATTKMLRMSSACNATAYDIEFQLVNAGDPAPSAGTAGMALLAGDDFPQGIPIGDIYARSATLQKLIVWSA